MAEKIIASKVQRSIQDSIESLKSELAFLKQCCSLYDKGDGNIAKKIALSLRILLHDNPRNNCKSILSQVGIKDKTRFLDSAHPYNAKNLLPSSCLTLMQISSSTNDRVKPLLGYLNKKVYKDFQSWWQQIVLDDKAHKFSREEIIRLVADKDGGAHIDSELPEHYYNLTRNNSMNWLINVDGVEKPLINFCFASIRQIGYEIDETLNEIDETLNELRIELWRFN